MEHSTNIKRYGSTNSGSHHWIMQRLSALALIPVVLWLLFIIAKMVHDPVGYLPRIFMSPVNSIVAILLIVLSMYHGMLGIKVIIEDYVTCKYSKNILIIGTYFLSGLTAISGIVAIIYCHVYMLPL